MSDHRSLEPAARLRQAREGLGLSHRQVADATKLSVRTIEALERGALGELPQGVYRRSMIRTVARELGLNPDEVLRDMADRDPDALPAPAVIETVAPATRTALHRAIGIASAVVPLVAGVIYLTAPFIGGLFTPRAPIVQEQPMPLPPLEVIPIGGFGITSLPLKPAPVVVTLTISSRCQLRIIADGVEVLSRTMEQGESVPLELGGEIVLLGNDAAAVQFSINGQAGRPLGDAGDVLSVRIGRDDYQDFLARH